MSWIEAPITIDLGTSRDTMLAHVRERFAIHAGLPTESRRLSVLTHVPSGKRLLVAETGSLLSLMKAVDKSWEALLALDVFLQRVDTSERIACPDEHRFALLTIRHDAEHMARLGSHHARSSPKTS